MAYRSENKRTWIGEIKYKDLDGKERSSKKRGFTTKREAVEWENKQKETMKPYASVLFENFVDIYFEDKASLLKPASIVNKRHMINKHLIPYFKGKKMNEITPRDVLRWQQMIKEKGYSESYLRMLNNQISALFYHCTNMYDLPKNPCKKVKKMGKSDVRRLEFWEKSEFDTFMASMEPGTRYYLLFEVLFWTGMREGECLALTPADIEFENSIIHVNKTYYRSKGEDIITSPKTEESIRDVIIPESLGEDLKAYIDMQYGFPDNERLFPIVHEAVQHKMKRQIEKSGLRKITVHGLRHSCCAYLISQGVEPMVIKKQLGHKDIKITLNTYGHLYKSQDDQLKDLLTKLKKSPNDGNQMDS